MATAQDTAVKPDLLFIPGISGFTKLVQDTEILHSQRLVQELPEKYIDNYITKPPEGVPSEN